MLEKTDTGWETDTMRFTRTDIGCDVLTYEIDDKPSLERDAIEVCDGHLPTFCNYEADQLEQIVAVMRAIQAERQGGE